MSANATIDISGLEKKSPAPVFPRSALRTFHLSGRGLENAIAPGEMRPVALETLPGLTDLETYYPLCIAPDGTPQPLREVVAELEHAGIVTSAFRTAMNHASVARVSEVAPEAIASLVECPAAEISRLRKLLPEGAQLIGFQAASFPALYAVTLVASRRKQREHFLNELRRAAARLRELLATDLTHGKAAVSAESVSNSLGREAGGFFYASRLAGVLQRRANPLSRMAPERLARCGSALATLEAAIHEAADEPAFWLFHSGTSGFQPRAFGGAERLGNDGFPAALELCELQLVRLAHVLRALRVARLEMEDAYNPAIHDEMLERFDWQSASPEEISLLPPIVVFATAESAAQASLTSFGKLLRSGRPIQVLISSPGLSPEDLQNSLPDFGYLTMSHREAFVLQASMASTAHLIEGLTAMAKTLRPAVAIVAVPPDRGSEGQAWLEALLPIQSRTYPLYRYDPGAGTRWSERFQLQTAGADFAGLSAAVAAAVSIDFRKHFRLIPPAAWESEQLEVAAYLEAYTANPPLAIPFVWVTGPNGTQQRAALTRELVNFCHDRQQAWTLFEDMASAGKPQPVASEEARAAGAKEAIEKVLALLGK